jgi:hypothetical protein
MLKLRVLCGVAMLSTCLAPAAHADEWSKLTYFTFSAPVEMPGIVLPAGTYKFELADPDNSRRVVRVSDKEGGKVHGTFLSIPNQMLDPAAKPLVMFKEAPAGAPEAVKAWFYPGEATGYEFVYPHDQALKIAKSIHAPVLTAKGEVTDTTQASDTTRIDENDRAASSATTTAAPPAPPATTAQVIQPPATIAPQPQPTPRGTTITEPSPVGTSGQTNSASRQSLPRTASLLPLMELLSGLSIAGGFAFRALRKSLA